MSGSRGRVSLPAEDKLAPRSRAARADTDVAIWSIRMDAGASWTLPPAAHAATARANDDPVQGREEGRFAHHADGRVER